MAFCGTQHRDYAACLKNAISLFPKCIKWISMGVFLRAFTYANSGLYKSLKWIKHKILSPTAFSEIAAVFNIYCLLLTLFWHFTAPAKLQIKFTSISVSSPPQNYDCLPFGFSKQTHPYHAHINYVIHYVVSQGTGQPPCISAFWLCCMLLVWKTMAKCLGYLRTPIYFLCVSHVGTT
jgi:hypothetical protein